MVIWVFVSQRDHLVPLTVLNNTVVQESSIRKYIVFVLFASARHCDRQKNYCFEGLNLVQIVGTYEYVPTF